ncbi:MAG: alpha/beta hydrolase [bacterium]
MSKSEKPTIIILHGWGACGSRFKEAKNLLENRGYKVFTPDLPGFGPSRPPVNPLTLGDYVEFVKKYISKEKLERAVLVGHSFGGRVACEYAALGPKELEKLILVAPSGIKHPSIKAVVFKSVAKLGKTVFGGNESLRRLLYRVVRERDYYRASPVMRVTMSRVLQSDLRPNLNKINVSTLIVWGEKDTFVPVKDARIMEREIPHSTLKILKNEGHLFPYEKPHKFVKIITDYVT